ncbi:MAG: division/cell wall cluster transcriptional repressor MraZ [Pseudomonadota bacterium]|jgi:MraZ protein
MFRGSSFHTIDSKGRLIVPARFRDTIRAGGGESLMLSGMDACLVAYTREGWAKIEAKILNMAERSETMRRFRRIFIGGASECACDKQDRILIPPNLREYAVLNKDIVLVGVLDHFEIWSRESWDTENLSLEEDMKREDVRNEIAKLGL